MCIGQEFSVKLPPPVGVWTPAPANELPLFWMEYDETGGVYEGIMGVGGALGVYPATFIDSGDPEPYTITVSVQNCNDYPVVPEVCIDRRITLIWLNQAGGWSNFNFYTKREHGFTGGDNTTFKTPANVLKFASRENIYKRFRLLTGYQDKAVMEHLETMFDSIQVIGLLIPEIPEDTGMVFIEPADRVKYSDGTGLWQIEFTVRIATEKIIQTQ